MAEAGPSGVRTAPLLLHRPGETTHRRCCRVCSPPSRLRHRLYRMLPPPLPHASTAFTACFHRLSFAVRLGLGHTAGRDPRGAVADAPQAQDASAEVRVPSDSVQAGPQPKRWQRQCLRHTKEMACKVEWTGLHHIFSLECLRTQCKQVRNQRDGTVPSPLQRDGVVR